MERRRVALVDDHELFRQGLTGVLRGEEDIEVVWEAGSGEDAMESVVASPPDVLLLDASLPGMSGIEVIRQAHARVPGLRVVVLTMSTADEDVLSAVAGGADGYLLKDASPGEIVAGVRAAAAGGWPISPRIARVVVERARRPGRDVDGAPPVSLSARELEVLQLLAEGRGNEEIAKSLYISPRTAKNHVSAVLNKLGVENRTQAAVLAVRGGWI